MPSLVWPSLLVAQASTRGYGAHVPRSVSCNTTMSMSLLRAYPFEAASNDLHAPYSTRSANTVFSQQPSVFIF